MKSPMYPIVVKIYERNGKDVAVLTAAVNRGWITEVEKQEILGE